MAEMMNYPYEQSQQQPMYQQMPVSSDELYAYQMQEERIRNIISQISPENQLNDIEMRIKGYKKNLFTGEWEKINPNIPEPNATLVSNYISYLSSIMNQSTTFGNVSPVQVNKLMKLIIEYIVDDLDANAADYGIAGNFSERTRIGHIILNSTFLVLTRAVNGMEARRIFSALSLQETMNPYQSQKRPSEWWKFWKK